MISDSEFTGNNWPALVPSMLGGLFLSVFVNKALPFRRFLKPTCAIVYKSRRRQAIGLALAAHVPVEEVYASATKQDAYNGDNGQNELMLRALSIIVALAIVAAAALARA